MTLEHVARWMERERTRLREAYALSLGSRVPDLVTPALILDLRATRRNIDRMAKGTRERGCGLRPHIKVHKSPDLARLQMDAGALGLSTATVWEAAVMAAAGMDGLFVVNTVAGTAKLGLLAEVARERSVLVALDETENARAVAAAAREKGSVVGILVEVDTGMDRAGVDTPAAAAELAGLVSRLEGARLEGVTGYEGHCSLEDDVARRRDLQRKAMERLLAARDAIRHSGLDCRVVSAGGTRTWWLTAATEGVTEIQAGTYTVMDAFHSGLEGGFEHSLRVAATVISRAPGRLIVDAGNKTVAAPTLARILGRDERVLRFDEEHGIFVAEGREPRVGAVVELIPGYAPTTVNNFDVIHVVEDDRVVDLWPVLPRGPGHGGILS